MADSETEANPWIGPAAYARACVERLVAGRQAPAAPPQDPYGTESACFVSIKKSGELRGCIGTLSPAEPNLGEEIARNAFSAAFRDPRFPPVGADELGDLSYTVDVLSESEPCSVEDLDPHTYGVIVFSGWRRGVLLPDLPGVDSVARQVDIALQKAGIGPGEPFEVARFTVVRYREGVTPRATGEDGEAGGDER